ncbi:MAG: MarR family winged helix-turn-helix transcriptional regulator [Labedaea sp.]
MGTQAPLGVKDDLMYLLSQASHVLLTELTSGLAELGISQRGYCVLSKALATGDLSQIRLAELCNLDKTTMVVTMDELERAGLAERRPDAHDRRARIIRVTEAGGRMVAAAEQVVAQIYADVLGTLADGEREAFMNGLLRLVRGRLSTPTPCSRPVRRRSPKA